MDAWVKTLIVRPEHEQAITEALAEMPPAEPWRIKSDRYLPPGKALLMDDAAAERPIDLAPRWSWA